MKRKPRWTLEILTGALAVLCGLLFLVLLVQRPAGWPVLAVLVVLWGIGMGLFRYRLRSWLARWVTGGSFENSKTQYSLESLSQPAAVLSGETVLWYNTAFRQRLLGGEDRLASRAQKLLPGLDLQLCRTADGQQLNLADGVWSIHSSTVPGQSESVTLLIFNEETALRRVEAEYKASRPGYMVFLVDGYDDVFSDMLDSERARLLEGINRVLEDLIGRGTGFLRRVASGRYIAVVEERHLEQYAKRGYDVLDKIRALDPSVNLSISIGIGRGAKTLREAQDMAVQALDMAQGRGGDQAAEMTPDGFTFYGGVSHGVEKRSKVRSRIVADQLVKLIKEADHVVIMGHRMSDLDAIGAAEGVLRICKICDVPAVIAVRRDATLAGSLIDALVRAGQEDDFIDPKGALPIVSKKRSASWWIHTRPASWRARRFWKSAARWLSSTTTARASASSRTRRWSATSRIRPRPVSWSRSCCSTSAPATTSPTGSRPRACSPALCWIPATSPCTPVCAPLKPQRPSAAMARRPSGSASCSM